MIVEWYKGHGRDAKSMKYVSKMAFRGSRYVSGPMKRQLA